MADVGRPTVITDEVLRKLDEAFATGCADLEACLYADISKTALYEYQQKHPAFAEHKEKLKETPMVSLRIFPLTQVNPSLGTALSILEQSLKQPATYKPVSYPRRFDGVALDIRNVWRIR